MNRIAGCLVAALWTTTAVGGDEPPLTISRVLAETTAADWRVPRPEDTVYLDLDSGRVIIELAPDFAPRHADNIRRLVREGYFDGAEIARVHENYVVQWVQPDEDRPLGSAAERLPLEGRVDHGPRSDFTPLPDGDVYAPEVGFSAGFPVARDPAAGKTWLAHCYAMVGVSRGMEADSGNGSSLYAVIGHSPRHLDDNITLAGRVIHGMEHLTTLPRGTGNLGFYEDEAEHVQIRAVQLAAELPEAERTQIELLRTDTRSFERLITARRHNHHEWYLEPVGRVSLCNVPLPARLIER